MQRTYPPHSRHYHGPAAPKARRAWLWIVLLTPVAIIGTIGFVLSLGLLFNMTGEELELTAPERELVLDITHLSMWLGEYAPDAAAETVTKTRYIDDSYEIEYVYDVPEDDAAPYLTYTLAFEQNTSDATTTYHSYWGGTKVAFYVFGDVDISVEEKNELFAWGEESKFRILEAEGVPFRQRVHREKGRKPSFICWYRSSISTTRRRSQRCFLPYSRSSTNTRPRPDAQFGRSFRFHRVDRFDDVEKVILYVHDLESRSSHVPERRSIQIWTEATGNRRHEIEHETEGDIATSGMFEHVELPRGFEQPEDLPQALYRARHGAKRARREDLIEAAIGLSKLVDVRMPKLNSSLVGLDAGPGLPKHLRADVQADDSAAWWKQRDVQTRSHGDEENPPATHASEELLFDRPPAFLGAAHAQSVQPLCGEIPLPLRFTVQAHLVSRPRKSSGR